MCKMRTLAQVWILFQNNFETLLLGELIYNLFQNCR